MIILTPFEWFVAGVLFIALMCLLDWMFPKKCPVCKATMLEYDHKNDYCPNDKNGSHKAKKLYEK